MKNWLSWIAGLGTLITPLSAQEVDVRKWTSSKGSTFDGFIVGQDSAGNLLLQAYAPKTVPLASLSAKDQEYAKAWLESHKKDQAALAEARDAEAYKAVMLAPLKGGLVKAEGKELKSYTPKKPEAIKLLAFYMTDGAIDTSTTANSVSDIYEKEQDEQGLFEIIYMPLEKTEAAMKKALADHKVKFPVVDFVFAKQKLNGTPVGNLFKGGLVPQLAVVTVDGKLISHSLPQPKDAKPKGKSVLVNQNEFSGNFSRTTKALEEAIRDVKKGKEPTPTE